MIHFASILGEFGFGADKLKTFKLLEGAFRSKSPTDPAYMGRCYWRVYLRISLLSEEPIRTIKEEFAPEELGGGIPCRKRLFMYYERLGYNYGDLREELSSNINIVNSAVTEDKSLTWETAECTTKFNPVHLFS